jgi:hypothetical protein
MDIEEVVLAFVRQLVSKHGFRLPIHVASLAPNGSVLFSRFEATSPAAPGSATLEHVTGQLEADGFEAPVHLLATDATGRAKVGLQRPTGAPVVLEFADPDAS